MIRNQLAKHLGPLQRKVEGLSAPGKERRDVSPRSTVRLDQRGRYSVPPSEQAASHCPGPLELWHRAGPLLHVVGCRQHVESPASAGAATPSVSGSANGTNRPPTRPGDNRRGLDVTTCSRPCWPDLKNWPGPRVALALDATSLADRLTVLSLSLVYRGTAIPVAWKILRGNQPHAWKPEWLKLLGWFAGRVDPTWTVTVMTDRGLYCAVAVPGDRRLGLAPHDARDTAGEVPAGGLEPAPRSGSSCSAVGCTWQGRGVAFPRRPERRLACTLLACWTEGHEDGWYVLTDLPPQCGRRGLVRPADVDRARLRAVQIGGLAVAEDADHRTRPPAGCGWRLPWRPSGWSLSAGERDHDEGPQETVPNCRPPTLDKRGPASPGGKRLVSVFLQGLAVILALLSQGQLARPEVVSRAVAWG